MSRAKLHEGVAAYDHAPRLHVAGDRLPALRELVVRGAAAIGRAQMSRRHLECVNAVNTAANDFERASDDGTSEVGPEGAGPMIFTMDLTSADVALRFGCSPRHARSLATRLGARKVRGQWWFPTDAVELEAARRAR